VSLVVFGALLVAALLHAVWNAMIRRDPDRNAAATAIAGGGAITAVVLLPFLTPMSPAAFPYVLATSCIHVVYFALVARAYRHGELSVAYPIMRGLAPLIVTCLAAFLVEIPAPVVVTGIAVVAGGIVLLGAGQLRGDGRVLAPAVANAFVIALYTLVDGLGARASEAPETYTAWILLGSGIATVFTQLIVRGKIVIEQMRLRTLSGLSGGAMSFAAYGIALWAMTIAPIGAVAAVRESSVLFATAIGAVVLRERFGWLRWVAAILVVAGLVMVKAGQSA
jgi:drug/metabolite transporter (DMT)-like permease